ncbi:hypothetical protein BGX29_012075 [Mortierella sp. GBA35]|nr:hypothetical protein BGX29_012075 [Mortierella sp. GBA35]
MATTTTTTIQHSFVFDNKDDPVLRSIAQELHTSLNQHRVQDHKQSNNLNDADQSLHQYEFRLESFLTRPRTCSKLFPPRVQKSRYGRIVVQERLVLVSAGRHTSTSNSTPTDTNDNDTDKDKKANHALVAGLEVLEYTLTPLPSPINKNPQDERIVYIAKVDTSGCWPLPGLETKSLKSPAQALVKGYLLSVRATSHGLSPPASSPDISTTDSSSNNNNSAAASAQMSTLSITAHSDTTTTTTTPRPPQKTSLYIFARAQPQYLFAESAKNPQKRVLDDRGLVRWWKNMVASVYAPDDSSPEQEKEEGERRRRKTKVQGWWHIPGIETERQAHNVIQSTSTNSTNKNGSTATFQWNYGYPDKDSKEMAHTLIPQFPDDPKSRMMQSPSCQGGYVDIRTFWELAAIGEESGAGKITGFFRVVEESQTEAQDEVEAAVREGSQEKEGEASEGTQAPSTSASISGVVSVTGTTAGYTKVINFLLDLDFSTLESAQRSTLLWQDRLYLWIRKSIERESDHAEELKKKQQEEEGEKDNRDEKGIAVAKPLWIQKGALNIHLRHTTPGTIPATSNTTATQEKTNTATTATAPMSDASASTPVVVNTLSLGLIKRKAPTPAPTTPGSTVAATATSATSVSAVNVLGAGLIKRKVVPTATTTPSDASAAPAVNVLGAGLIKRKVATTTNGAATIAPSTASDASAAAPVVNVLGASFIKRRKTDC